MAPKTAHSATRNDTIFRPVDPFHQPGNHIDDRGLLWNAQIVTMAGLMRIQNLKPGAAVVTRSSGAAVVRQIDRTSCLCRGIYVVAGSLGHNRADRDSLLPAGQPVLVRDWRARALARADTALLPAAALVDGEFVRDIGLQVMTLYRLTLDRPGVLYADGMELGCATPYELWPTGACPDRRANTRGR